MFQSYNAMHFNIGGRRESYNLNFGGRGEGDEILQFSCDRGGSFFGRRLVRFSRHAVAKPL